MAQDRQFRVESSCELLVFLVSLPIGLSRKAAKDLLRFRTVSVRRTAELRRNRKNDVRHDTRLEPGDVVTIAARPPARAGAFDLHGLKIVHLDDAIAVVDKPAGLLSMGSQREKERTTHRILNEYLKQIANSSLQQAYIVHRLDRETSGLMVFARSESIQAALQENWGAVTKRYFAIVEGIVSNRDGTLRDHLLEDPSFKVRRVAKGGELAITHYRVLASARNRTLMELTLETGRKHQIRVQLAALGHPVIGDRKYGAGGDPARRLGLHSCALEFRHPGSGVAMNFRSALPAPILALIERRRSR
ncbi:MAG TPA: RluA family pseudouridine synthase [Candidatus Binataceae bacterium]|nr:RluA family pseudouridine synthase [Candidatus Binataceae bacterium]